MSSNEAKRIISEGLEQRRIERNQREAALEDQARNLRLTINDNHTARNVTEALKMEAVKVERKNRQKARREKENSAILATHYYIRACTGIVLAALLTPLPWWAAAALIVGGAVFPIAHILRLEVSV